MSSSYSDDGSGATGGTGRAAPAPRPRPAAPPAPAPRPRPPGTAAIGAGSTMPVSSRPTALARRTIEELYAEFELSSRVARALRGPTRSARSANGAKRPLLSTRVAASTSLAQTSSMLSAIKKGSKGKKCRAKATTAVRPGRAASTSTRRTNSSMPQLEESNSDEREASAARRISIPRRECPNWMSAAATSAAASISLA